MAPILVLVVVLGAAGIWFVSAYNRLVGLKNQVANGWKQIDVQLKRRHDLIPNLVETVKGAMTFERGTLEAVIAARNQAIGVVRGGGGAAVPSAGEVRQLVAAENQLSGALGKLFAVVEAYPQLKATGNAAALQEELASTENKIAFARQLYNDQATSYNTAQQQFPTNMVAGMAGAAPAELWAIADAAEREVPKVNLAAT
ncbi:MAG TPA: LemA family protein [Polyangia bacterium]|nr:LemA family protein [Polyangia bacterium]